MPHGYQFDHNAVNVSAFRVMLPASDRPNGGDGQQPSGDNSMTAFGSAAPRQCLRWALRTLYVSGPLSVAVLIAWAFQLVPWLDERPQLVMMVYVMLLSVAICAVVVASLAACHLAIAQAFSAGLHAGANQRRTGRDRSGLRIVD